MDQWHIVVMSKEGRNTVRTAAITEALVEALEGGNTHKVACAIAGISTATFYDWKSDDLEFLDTIKKAEAEAEKLHVKKITTDRSWQSAAWMLERRNNGEWGRKDSLKIQGDKDKPLVIMDLSNLSIKELEKRYKDISGG